MKRLTLDQTWKLCMSMWRWVAKQKRQGLNTNVPALKHQWLNEHGYKDNEVLDDCFFCEYVYSREVGCCPHCPGIKVDKDFDCTSKDYNWSSKPIAFYNKLRSLNRKRLAKRRT